MKKILFITLLATLLSSCSTTYNYYITTEPTTLYADESSASVQGTIPAQEMVITKGKKAKRNYVRYFSDNYAWVSLENCIHKGSAPPTAFDAAAKSTSASTVIASGGTVQVKGYYRKDGTYVKPHSRKAPKKGK
ncbi:MAG TPA: membrane lipoprotein lipid attachment site-containing protein [Flavisolibacter sp.]|jgi:hypothetical protein|nr:membrane lipoprotein lipid attachment site-containing protein [Flavisolibacter sp.]